MAFTTRWAAAAGLSAIAAAALAVFLQGAAAGTDVGPVGYPTDTTWSLAGSPYYVNGPINVIADLTIEAGVEVYFNVSTAIAVLGSIHVNGDASNPVVFASNNTTAVPSWSGIQINLGQAASVILNATIDRASIGIDIMRGNAGVDISDVLITNATTWGIRARQFHQTSYWSNITVLYSGGGFNLVDSSLIYGNAFATGSLTGGAPWALQGDLFASSAVVGLSFPGGRLQCTDCSNVDLADIAVSSASFPTGIDLVRPNIVSLDGVRVRGFTQQGILADGGVGLKITNVDIARMGGTIAGVGALLSRSTSFMLSGGTIFDGTVGLSAPNSPAFLANNLTINGSATAVYAMLSPGFRLEDSTLGNASLTALDIDRSGGSSTVRNVSIWNSVLGVRVNGRLAELAIDFSLQNAINGAPILGIFNTPLTTVNPASAFAWVYVYGSANTVVNTATIAPNAGQPAFVWADSDFGQIDGVYAQGTGVGMLISRSNGVSVGGAAVSAGQQALHAVEGGALTIHDSSFASTGADAIIMEAELDAQFTNVTGVTTALSWAGLHDWFGANNRYTNSQFNGTVGVFADRTARLQVDTSRLCGGEYALRVEQGTDIGSLGNLYCAGPAFAGVEVTTSTRTRVENSSFSGLTQAIRASTSAGTIVRWNIFDNCTVVGVSFAATNVNSLVYENNFHCGSLSALDASATGVTWYNSTRNHGNYWDNYAGLDTNGDFIGETPYNIPGTGNRRDLYPLVLPFETQPPVAIVSATTPIDEDTTSELNGSRSADNVAISGGTWVIHDAFGDAVRQGLVVNYLFATPGFYRCDFTVRDAWNNSAPGTVYVRVNDKTPPIIVPPVGPFAVDEDLSIVLNIQVDDNDPFFPNGNSFVWRITGRENTSATTGVPYVSFLFSQPGLYTGNVTAFDLGLNSAMANFTITVRDRTAPTFDFRTSGVVPPGQGETVHMEMAIAADNDLAFPQPGAFSWMITFPQSLGFIEDHNQSVDLTPSIPGSYTVAYEARDPSGNVRNGTWVFFAADTEAPVWTPPTGLEFPHGSEGTLSVKDATDFSGLSNATWRDGGTVIGIGLVFVDVWVVLGPHEISVVITDNVGNEAAFGFTLTIVDRTPPHQLSAVWSRNISVRQQDRVELEAFGQFSDNDPMFTALGTYAWSTDSATVTWGSPQDSSHAVLAYSDLGTFVLTLRVRDPAGNYLDVAILIVVSDGLPPSNIVWGVLPNFTLTLGTTAHFHATATDPSGVFFRWDFGDGEQAEGGDVSYTYVSADVWTVTLTAYDGIGNEERITFTILVRDLGTGAPGPGPGPGPNANNGSAGIPMMTLVMIIAVIAVAGVAAMAVAFRKRLKRPKAPETVIVQPDAPVAVDPWAPPPASEYDALYGPSTYDPNERPPGST